MRFHILQPAQLMRRATVLMSLRLECSIHCACMTVCCFTELQKFLLCFPTWNIVICILCMDFATAMHVLLLKNIKGVLLTEGFRLKVFLLVLTRHCMILAVFQVLLCGLKGRWYERLTHERTLLRWFREVHVCPLIEWLLTSAYHLDFLTNELPGLLEDIPLMVRSQMYFQHDGAPPHYTRHVREYVNESFPNHWLGRGGPVPWAPRSPDLTPLDYYL